MVITSQVGAAQVGDTWTGGYLSSGPSVVPINLLLTETLLIFDATLEITVTVSAVSIYLNITDVIVQNDSQLFGYGLIPSDQLQLNDYLFELFVPNSVTGNEAINIIVTEYSLPLVDNVSDIVGGVQQNLTLSLSDTFEFLDNFIQINLAGTAIPALDLLLTDNLYYRLNDNVQDALSIPWIASDTLGLNDANGVIVQFLQQLNVNVSDTFTFIDSLGNFSQSIIIIAADSLNLSDSSTYSSQYGPSSFSDSFGFTDSVGILLTGSSTTLVDDFSFSDSVTVQLNSIFNPLTLVFADTLVFNDLINVNHFNANLFTDTFVFQDNCVVSLQTNLTDYLRRYLNDVVNPGNAA